ncbi:MAG: PHB depolymerase family esterase [Pseudomonadota bacterium]
MSRRMLLALALLLTPGWAAACGTAETVCEAADGTYYALLPEGEAKGTLFFLHGMGARAEGIVGNTGLVETALARGYALISPQGLPWREGQRGGIWNVNARPELRDDIAWLDAVAEDAAARFGLDRGAMIMAGFSGGGMMAWRVACDAPATFAAYGPVAGLLWEPFPEACAGPVRLHHTHGWTDPVVPIEGRTWRPEWTQGDLFAGLDLLRAALACEGDQPDAYDAREPYLIRSWSACAEGAALALAIHPGGHSIPRGWTALFLDWLEAPAADPA